LYSELDIFDIAILTPCLLFFSSGSSDGVLWRNFLQQQVGSSTVPTWVSG